MSGFYSGAESILKDIKAQRKRYKDSAVTAERLPYDLKNAYREKGDPKLDKTIAGAEQRMLGGAIEGLNKFQNIENPFKRRALAEQYQGSLSKTYSTFTSERDRRQGVIQDYINMWSGTYGAVAKGEQIALQGMESDFSNKMQLGNAQQSQSNWERSFARSGSGSKATNYTNKEIIQTVNKLKGENKKWEEIASLLAGQGIDVSEKSVADNELRRLHGYKQVGEEGAQKTEKQKNEDKYYKLLNEVRGSDDYKISEDGTITKTKGRNKIIMYKP